MSIAVLLRKMCWLPILLTYNDTGSPLLAVKYFASKKEETGDTRYYFVQTDVVMDIFIFVYEKNGHGKSWDFISRSLCEP